MHDLGDVLLRDVDGELWPLEGFKGLVDTRNTSNLASARTCIDAFAIVRLAVLEGCRNVDGEEVRTCTSLVKDGVLHGIASSLCVDGGRKDNSSTCTCKLCSDEGETLKILRALLRGSGEG